MARRPVRPSAKKSKPVSARKPVSKKAKKAVTRKVAAKPAKKPRAKPRPAARAQKPAPLAVGLQLDLGGQGDLRQLDELTRLLQVEIARLDVTSVEMIGRGELPPGAKGMGLAAVGGLMIKLMSGEVFKNLIEAVKAWAGRDSGRSAKVAIGGDTIELAHITPADQARLIEIFERKAGARIEVRG